VMAATSEIADLDIVANVKPWEICLLDMELSMVFFHGYRSIGLTLGNLNW
jgi:hypothetical protein